MEGAVVYRPHALFQSHPCESTGHENLYFGVGASGVVKLESLVPGLLLALVSP